MSINRDTNPVFRIKVRNHTGIYIILEERNENNTPMATREEGKRKNHANISLVSNALLSTAISFNSFLINN